MMKYDDYEDYLVCYFIGMKIMDENNNLDKKKLKDEYLKDRRLTKNQSARFNKCVVKKKTPKATAVAAEKCIEKI